MTNFDENQISRIVLEAAIKIHKALGPGLLESAYEACLCYELSKSGLSIERQKALPLKYENVKLDVGYRIDLWVNKKVIIEIKSIDKLNDVHLAQILTYLKLTQNKLGLLINFNFKMLKAGFKHNPLRSLRALRLIII